MNSSAPLLDAVPIWAIFLITVAIAVLAAEIGYRLGLWQHQRAPGSEVEFTGSMVGMTFGLLAFMLAIQTGIAVSRYDSRRELVIAEANAIGTTFLRAGFLPDPFRGEIRELLREYVDVRVTGLTPGEFSAVKLRSEALHDALWSRSEAALEVTGSSDLMALYFEPLNEVIDLHTSRIIAAMTARLPVALWVALLAVGVLSMLLLGFNSGQDGRHNRFPVVVMVLVFAVVISLVADLDRPYDGLFQVNYQPLLELQSQINR